MSEFERWLPIAGFEGFYEVSDLGRVRSLVRRNSCWKEFLSPIQCGNYKTVGLYDADAKEHTKRLHRLVLAAFRGPMPPSIHGAHLDGDPSNNRLSNLAWVTPKENEAHKILHGRANRAGRAKLNHQSAAQIRKAFQTERPRPSFSALGRRYGVGHMTIAAVIQNRRWSQPQP